MVAALLASISTAPDQWLTALNTAKPLIAVWLFGLFVYIAVILLRRKRRLDAGQRASADDQPFATLPDDGQTITVYAKKSRVALYMLNNLRHYAIAVGVFFALSGWSWFRARYQIDVVLAALFDLLFGILLLLGAAPLLFSVACFLSNAPILIVNAEGVTDNATFIATGMGLIPWREISEVFIHDPRPLLPILPARRLIIVSKNTMFVRQQALWKRVFLAFTLSSELDVARIPEVLLPMPLEELRAQIEEYLRAHGHHGHTMGSHVAGAS